MSDKQWVIDNLVETLRLMASPYPEQVAALPEWVAIPDEVGLLFEDAYGVLESDEFPPDVQPLLEAINERLSSMMDQPRDVLWTRLALEIAPEWEMLRQEARRTLDAWRMPMQPPRIDPGAYVPA